MIVNKNNNNHNNNNNNNNKQKTADRKYAELPNMLLSTVVVNYSPAAIIRNTKIGNLILLHAFFRTISLNLDLEYPVRRKLFEESTTTALTPNILGISTILGFLKSGGGVQMV